LVKNCVGKNLEYKSSKFAYKKRDFKKLREFLDKQDWGEKFENKNVQYCYSEFLKIYNQGCEAFIPKIEISGNFKTRPKWLTRGIKSNMRKRLNLWYANKRAKGRDVNLLREYENLKKLCDCEVKIAVKDHERKIANNAKNNPKMV
jgi:hypothetical protein